MANYNTYRNVDDTLDILQIDEKELSGKAHCLKQEDLGKWVFNLGGLYYGFYDTRQECQDRVNQLMCD